MLVVCCVLPWKPFLPSVWIIIYNQFITVKVVEYKEYRIFPVFSIRLDLSWSIHLADAKYVYEF